VWVIQAEIDAMAQTLGMTPEAFEKAYVRTVGRRRSLREMADGDCVFYDRPMPCLRGSASAMPVMAVLVVERSHARGVATHL
jgi:hypothetical protein